jgi:anion-transporting  ArsA/GET3 family ATPase
MSAERAAAAVAAEERGGEQAVDGFTDALSPLFGKRLVIVTGKGGTGKTTVAAALAVAAARSGLSVLVTDVGSSEQLAQRITPGHAPVGYAGCELVPGLTAMHIDPFEALAEYLGLQLKARSLVDLVLGNRGFHQLLEASPGWRELITLGKIWHLGQALDSAGRPRFPLIVVDAPATGHGLTFLDVPRVVASAVRAGPLRAHAQRVEDLIRDPEQCLLLPVALAEELPARETAELVARARDQLGVAVDRVVVNAVTPAPFPEPVPEDLDRLLSRVPPDADLGSLPPPSTLAACAAHLRARYELNLRYLSEIRQRCALPVVSLPYVAGGPEGADALHRFASALGPERPPAARSAGAL